MDDPNNYSDTSRETLSGVAARREKWMAAISCVYGDVRDLDREPDPPSAACPGEDV
jgi:hypothetical protein